MQRIGVNGEQLAYERAGSGTPLILIHSLGTGAWLWEQEIRRWSARFDVLALDGYNWGGGTPQFGGWRTFRGIFRKAMRRIGRLGPQPVWIAEVGSASDGGNKSRWVRAMFRTARKWKRLQAIVWYDQDKERDWSTASAASAFRAKPRR